MVIAMTFAAVSSTNASETDAFTFRYTDFPSAVPMLNAEVNKRIDAALSIANAWYDCDLAVLDKTLGIQLRRYMVGMLDEYINTTESLPKMRVKPEDSVYKYVRWDRNWPVHFGKMGFGAVIRAKNYLIGSDKFGHFFDEGYRYYRLRESGKSLVDVIAWGIETENGGLGLSWHGTGVRSYGDAVANFQGAAFWSNILTPIMNEQETKQFFVEKPYIACKKTKTGKKWFRINEFDFNDYIDAGWDEGYNCNRYRSKVYAAEVRKGIQELEAKSGKRYSCPVAAEDCIGLQQKYGTYSILLLSPECMNAK